MIKIHELIKKAAWDYAENLSGEEAEDSILDFTTGAEFVLDNVIGLKNHFPLVGIVTIQCDPNDKEAKLVSAKMSGLKPLELADLLIGFCQNTLYKSSNHIAHEIVIMPADEAARRRAFQESIEVVKAKSKIIKLD